MQIKIIGSHQCPDTLYALHVLAEKGYEVDFVDILGSHAGLKEYLTLRETDALYKDICGTQRLGIPCMILEDGTRPYLSRIVSNSLPPTRKSVRFLFCGFLL